MSCGNKSNPPKKPVAAARPAAKKASGANAWSGFGTPKVKVSFGARGR